MKEGVASLERPVLALRILLFLQRSDKRTLSGMFSQRWNRRTLEASLRRLKELELIEVEAHGSFPRFEKEYVLTQKGDYVTKFVIHLKEELRSSLGMDMNDFSKLPKGSTDILIYILDKGYDSISRMLEKLSMSPHQAYRCLASMGSKGILLREEYYRGKRKVSSFSLSEKGILVAVAVDALDKALKKSSSLCRRPYSGKEQ